MSEMIVKTISPGDIQRWALLEIVFSAQAIQAANDCLDVGMKEASDEIARIKTSARRHPNDAAVQSAAASQILSCLIAHLTKRRFLYINPDRADFLDSDALFGTQVQQAFPTAASDIRKSGNCLAAECSDAAVFHLMHVAECGLRALARDRQIVLWKNAVLDLATWEDMIKQLEGAELAIQGYPKTLAREKQYTFYHGAMMEFKRFKNVFRNPIMHARDEYDRDQAHGVFVHVREFMRILASKISETTTTPLIWI